MQLDTLLNAPLDELQRSLTGSLPPKVDDLVASALRDLVVAYRRHVNGPRFEILVGFLIQRQSLTQERAQLVLAKVTAESDWIYGGVTIAAHATELAGAAWLREHYPQMDSELKNATRLLVGKVNPVLRKSLDDLLA